jgi:hypothetical protein
MPQGPPCVRALTNEGELVHDEATQDIVLELEQRQQPRMKNPCSLRTIGIVFHTFSTDRTSCICHLYQWKRIPGSCRRSPVSRMHERENFNLQRNARMRTTIYLATAGGLAVIQGCDESWVGEVCLNDKQIQCVAADRTRKGVVYCGTFGNGMLRSSDRGATWHPLQNFTAPNVTALASSQSGALYAGTELSAMYRSEDGANPGVNWRRC